MANIDSLKTSFTDLEKDEAYSLLIDIRQSRRDAFESKRGRKSSSSTKKKKKKTKPSKGKVANKVKGLSKEEAQLLLQRLQNN